MLSTHSLADFKLKTIFGAIMLTLPIVAVGGVVEADLAITKTDGAATAIPGTLVIYAITASNAGPDAVTDADVTDNFPAELTCSWTCSAGAGSSCTAGPVNGNIVDGNVTIDVDSSVTYTATCDIAADATGTLLNTATVASAGGATDPNQANNTATDSDTLIVTANLRIEKFSNVTDMTMGDNVTYTIVATNDGPSHVSDANVVDNFNAPLQGCSWTSVAGVGASGNTNGSGTQLNDTLDMAPGSQVAYTVNCGTDPSSTVTTMSNTATIASVLANESSATDNTSVADIRMIIPVSVPTLSAWSLPLLALALASLVGVRARRSRRG